MMRMMRSFPSAMSVLALLFLVFGGGCSSGGGPVAVKEKTSFWPPPPDEPHVQFLVTYNSASDVKGRKKNQLDQLLYGKTRDDDVGITKPYGVAVWQGRIYVCDIRGAGILVLDVPKKEARLMGSQGAGEIKKAVDVTVAADGTKYVADMNRAAILLFDANDRFVRAFTHSGWTPVGVAVYGDELFVADTASAQVKVLDRNTGKLLRTVGDRGEEDGKFLTPLSVAIDKTGQIIVTDVVRCRISRFSHDGQFINAFGRVGNRAGDFVRPKHVRVGADGTIFVVDSAFNNVQVFDNEGKVMGFFGALGDHPGAMDLPAGLFVSEDPQDLGVFASYVHPAFQAERLVLVTSQFGSQKVSVYAVGQMRPGHSPSELTSAVGAATGLRGGDEPADTSMTKLFGATQPATQPATNRSGN